MPSLHRIMCVEDDADIRAIVQLSLENLGEFNIKICTSGREALIEVEKFSPDLIILDVMMPEMDGPETYRALRALPSMGDVPIIFMTAKVQAKEIEYFKSLGASDVIAKPFDPITLPDQIQAIWENHQK